MEKMILSIGIIALFIGMVFIPAGASVKTQELKSVEQKNNILSGPHFDEARIQLKSGYCQFRPHYIDVINKFMYEFMQRFCNRAFVVAISDPHSESGCINFVLDGDYHLLKDGEILITPTVGDSVTIKSSEYPGMQIFIGACNGWASSRDNNYLNLKAEDVDVLL